MESVQRSNVVNMNSFLFYIFRLISLLFVVPGGHDGYGAESCVRVTAKKLFRLMTLQIILYMNGVDRYVYDDDTRNIS